MKLDDFVLHRELIDRLKSSISQGRIPHAQYFQGAEGSGNLALAIGYAQEVMAQGKVDMFGNVDDRVARMLHPDLHIVFPVVQGKYKISEPLINEFKEKYIENPFLLFSSWMDEMDAGNKTPIISVSESEEIYKKLSLKSYEGGYKVLIIWQAELMNAGCSNKMLKLIEEPPDKTLILLVGSDIKNLLPTIQSRVQLVEVKPCSHREIEVFLKDKSVDPAQIPAAINQAGGSPGLALKLTSEMDDHLLLDSFKSLMRLAYQNNVPAAIKWTNDIATKGKIFQINLIDYGVDVYRQSNVMNFMQAKLTADDDLRTFLKNFGKFITRDNIEALMQTHQTMRYHLTRNGNAKLLFLDFTFQLMRLIK